MNFMSIYANIYNWTRVISKIFLIYPFIPVSMLTLIHNNMIPKVMGVAKIIDVIENLYFSKTFNIKLVIPTENKTEKK